MMRVVMYWALAGVSIPLAILIVGKLQGVFEWPYLAVTLWPGSILLMAIQHPDVAFQILVLAISIATNVVLYSTVGAVFWLLWSLFSRLTR